MSDALLMVYLLLSTLTAFVMLVHYRRLRQGSREYAKAKSTIGSLVISFNRDLQTQEQKIREISEKNEKAFADQLRALEEINSKTENIAAKLQELEKNDENLLSNYDALKRETDELASRRSEVLERLTKLETSSRERELPEMAEIEPAIPIRRDRVLAPLTETELRILRFLATEGEKTAPEIRSKIMLTREHTARLMKKLFAGGYIERATSRMPYLYRLKKEMEDLMRQQGEAT